MRYLASPRYSHKASTSQPLDCLTRATHALNALRNSALKHVEDYLGPTRKRQPYHNQTDPTTADLLTTLYNLLAPHLSPPDPSEETPDPDPPKPALNSYETRVAHSRVCKHDIPIPPLHDIAVSRTNHLVAHTSQPPTHTLPSSIFP